MSRRELQRKNYGAAQIDFIGAYTRLWISFNTWYSDRSSASRSEWQRIRKSVRQSPMDREHSKALAALNDARETDNLEHIVQTVEDHSIARYLDSNGNPVVQRTDVSGFRYRLICNKQNPHTIFMKAASGDPALAGWSRGLVFFNTESRKDPLFGQLHQRYGTYLYDNMSKRAAEDIDVPAFLNNMGVQQYGNTLYHNLTLRNTISSPIGSLDDTYGTGFVRSLSRIASYRTVSQVGKAFPIVGRQGRTYRMVESKGLSILERELLLMYKFRSSIVHGDRDPYDPHNQDLARVAYAALDELIRPAFA